MDHLVKDRAARVIIQRPDLQQWDDIIKVLETANFHQIGGVEMPKFPVSDCFVAVAAGRVIGVAGYQILDADNAKTTLMAIDPGWRGLGIGGRLQQARLDAMKARGVSRIYTNTDDERVIEWLSREYGFRRTGQTIPKVHSFGKDDVDHWVNLVLVVKGDVDAG